MNSVLFAVTREDYLAELSLVERISAEKVLCICSGGCTPLNLKAVKPQLSVSAFDLNPVQLTHVAQKISAVKAGELKKLNLNDSDSNGLNQCGQFEGLFRMLRSSFMEFVASASEIEDFFDPDGPHVKRKAMLESWRSRQYWRAPFEMSFNDPFLHLMFTERATRHAQPSSYISYFERKIYEGLQREDANLNPFLQHIFLGLYRDGSEPPYIKAGEELDLTLIQKDISDIGDLSSFQLLSLSNVFDWSDESVVNECSGWLKNLPSGAAVLIRQLNNDRDWNPSFSPEFYEDKQWEKDWNEKERSLFYDHHRVFFRK